MLPRMSPALWGSSWIWQNPKSTLQHSLQRHWQLAVLVSNELKTPENTCPEPEVSTPEAALNFPSRW